MRALALFLFPWLAIAPLLATEPTPPSPEADTAVGIDSRSSSALRARVFDRSGAPISGLGPGDFELEVDGRIARILSVVEGPSRNHLVLAFDLVSTPPADLHSSLPALRSFARERLLRDDRITIAALRHRARQPGPELLCRLCREMAPVEAALDRIRAEAGAAFNAHRHRRSDDKRETREARLALAELLGQVEGDGLDTHLLYSGRDLTLAAADSGGDVSRSALVVSDSEAGTSDAKGSVQYLVSLPRARSAEGGRTSLADPLLSRAFEAKVSIHPLIPTESALGLAGSVPGSVGRPAELGIAGVTGGRALVLRHLGSELQHLGKELDHAYALTFELAESADPAAGEGRPLHHLKLDLHSEDRASELRYSAVYPVSDTTHRLYARARSAWQLEGGLNPLHLSARLVADSGSDSRHRLELILPPPEGSDHLILGLAVPSGARWLLRHQVLAFRPSAEAEPLRLAIPLALPAETPGLGLALLDPTTRQISHLPLRTNSF